MVVVKDRIERPTNKSKSNLFAILLSFYFGWPIFSGCAEKVVGFDVGSPAIHHSKALRVKVVGIVKPEKHYNSFSDQIGP